MGDAEDLDYNPFFSTLQKKYPKLYDKAQETNSLICVPQTSSLTNFKPSQQLYEKYIFTPSPFLKGEYESIGKPVIKLRMHDNILHLVLPSGEKLDVKVLVEETYYNKSFQPFRVLCIDNMLFESGKGSATGSSSSIGVSSGAGGRMGSGSLGSAGFGSGNGIGSSGNLNFGFGTGSSSGTKDPATSRGIGGVFQTRSTFEENEEFLSQYTRTLRPLNERAKLFNEGYVVVDGYLEHLSERLMNIRDEVSQLAAQSSELTSVRGDARLPAVVNNAVECCLFYRVSVIICHYCSSCRCSINAFIYRYIYINIALLGIVIDS